jgi:hypothetical protein
VNIPRWYELSWDKEACSITLSASSKVWTDSLAGIRLETSPIVKEMLKSLSLSSFEAHIPGAFGFNGALIASQDGDLVRFKAKLPQVRVVRGKCEICGGSGSDFFFADSACLACLGDGKGRQYEWQTAYAISATFTILLSLLNFPETESQDERLQLLKVETMTIQELHGGSLTGEYSIPLVQWLSEHYGEEIEPMVQAMQTAHSRMFGPEEVEHNHWSFDARVAYPGGWLNVSCPGNACGLNPAHSYNLNEGESGYEFSCHNVDSPAQQLTLLAGLAALHDCVDEDLYGNSGC